MNALQIVFITTVMLSCVIAGFILGMIYSESKIHPFIKLMRDEKRIGNDE